MEKALGIRVVRHITKKPAGDAVDLEKHFRLALPISRNIIWLINRQCIRSIIVYQFIKRELLLLASAAI